MERNYVYLLQCADDTLYCGWTNDLTARLAAHNGGKSGAKYTRGRGPVTLVYSELLPTKSDALRREAAIKALTRQQKQTLIDSQTGGELLTIYDAAGTPCGNRPREVVHRQGLRHHVVHLWIISIYDGVTGIWLQQRARSKSLYPGWYDLAATGHIDPGETAVEGVLRETQEEIGLILQASNLIPCGAFPQQYDRGQAQGFDDELAHTFVYRCAGVPPFVLGQEVTRMVFLPLELFAAAHDDQTLRLNARTTAGTTAYIRADRICCLHIAEWRSIQNQLRNN